jgi:glycine/D-amino acid oxidase-like deaminating enzyme
MDLLSSGPFWPIKDGLPAAYPRLENDVTCDVAVIGAGITGALLAWHLVEAGFSTVVLDRREAAHGSTAGSTSLLQYEIDVPLHLLARRLGLESARLAYSDCLHAVHAIGCLVKRLKLDCGFEMKGSLFLASRTGHVPRLQREFAAREAAGFRVRWLNRRELSRTCSLRHPAGILSAATEAAQVDAYALTYGLLAAAHRKGARIHDRTTVTAWKTSGRRIELVTRGGARVRAGWLAIASGYEADAFLPERVTHLQSTYALATEPLNTFAGWPPGLPVIWETADPYVYLRTTPDRRVIMGGFDEPFRDPARRDRLLNRKVELLRRRFRRYFPELPCEVATAWAGTFGTTPDGLPYIGLHPGLPRTWFALGYGGNGITFSLIAAELFRDRLLGRPSARADLYGFERRSLNLAP